MRSRSIASLRFSPDSSKLGAIAGGKRVRVYDVASGRVRVAAEGEIRGYSFSPDSERIVVGRATKSRFQAPSDLFTGPALGGRRLERITDIGRAVNPVWGAREVIFDRFRRRAGDTPSFNLWAVEPVADGALRRLTALKIPPLANGLVPLELSADGRRLLAVFAARTRRSASRSRRAVAGRARSRRTSRPESSASTSRRTAGGSSPTAAAATRAPRTTC
jgi:WD40 repeat protein